MKLPRKIIALLLVVSLMFVFVACQSGTETTSGTQSSSGTEAPIVKVPAEKIKIGFATFTTGSDAFRDLKKYYEYLAQTLNIEIVYSEAIGSAEKELNFIESCAAAGCVGIIAYYNIARATSAQLAIDKGMFYYGVAEEASVYDTFIKNDHYLGGYYYGANGEYETGYNMGKSLVDAGCKKLVYASGGADMGVKMFQDRQTGFYAAIDEAKSAGKDVEIVYDVKGWPNTPPFVSEQTAALGLEGVDGVASSFGIATWIQPIADIGKSDTIKLASNDALTATQLEPFASGQMVGLSAEYVSLWGMPIAMIINAVEGNMDCNRDAEGNAPRVPVSKWIITNNADFLEYYNIETSGIYAVNDKDILSLIKSYDPTASYEKLADLYATLNYTEIKARRAAQNK